MITDMDIGASKVDPTGARGSPCSVCIPLDSGNSSSWQHHRMAEPEIRHNLRFMRSFYK